MDRCIKCELSFICARKSQYRKIQKTKEKKARYPMVPFKEWTLIVINSIACALIPGYFPLDYCLHNQIPYFTILFGGLGGIGMWLQIKYPYKYEPLTLQDLKSYINSEENKR